MSIQSIENTNQAVALYKNTVYGVACAFLKNKTDADDVFQEVFLAYYKAGKTFANEEHRKAWLIKTTVNLCKKAIGSTARKRARPLEEADGKSVTFSLPEENALWCALCELEEIYRTVIYMYYFLLLPPKQIASACKISESTVYTRLKRGREQLKTKLEGEYFNERRHFRENAKSDNTPYENPGFA